MSNPRYQIADLVAFASRLFEAAGVAPEPSASMGTYLVAADALGHDTHGLALAPWYLEHVADGSMLRSGEPETLADRGGAVCWNGRRLPGAWLVETAMRLAVDRARTHGTCTIAVGNAHHIGALAVYLELATQAGFLASISSSSPSGAQVAPFGGLAGVFNPQPTAWGIPTSGDPILIDLSAALTTANMVKRLEAEGRSFETACLMDAAGNPVSDPRALREGGTILPVGGLDHGQKGYGMSLSIEALTQGLAGYGRADAPKGTNSAFTVQVFDPAAFGGTEAFLRQTDWVAARCRAVPPRTASSAVRMPGEAALRRRRDAEANGLVLYPAIMADLSAKARALGVQVPAPHDSNQAGLS